MAMVELANFEIDELKTQHDNIPVLCKRLQIRQFQNSSIRQSPSVFPVEVYKQIMVLIYPYPMQLGVGQPRREALPDGDRQVLGRWNAGKKFRDFFVQEAVVHGIEHFAVHGFLELLEVNHEAGAGIDLSLDRDFEDVVVPVSVGVIALAEEA